MIEIKSLTKSYTQEKEFYALKDINLKLTKGSLSIIYGESGSGKSTLLSIIAAITKPTKGEVLVQGENICSYNDYFASSYREKSIGFITQEFHLFESFTLEENIAIALSLTTLTTKEIAKKVYEIAQELHIEHKLKSRVSKLSGGEKQRGIIARALINNPEIILCDEPTAHLDKRSALLFIDTLFKRKALQKTILIVTHDALFDTVTDIEQRFFMKDGELE